MKKHPEEKILGIESCLSQGRIFNAYNLASTARKAFPDNVRIAQLYALSLARLGSTEKAKNCLEDLYNRGHHDSETAGILGRVYKDVLKKSGDIKYAYLSRDTYLRSFESLKEYYLGINASTMSYILGEKKKAEKIARQTIDIIDLQKEKDYWCLASLGEAYLILNDLSASTQFYKKAREEAHGNYGDLNSTYQQICFIEKYARVPVELLAIFKPPGIITFSGHMIDRADRKVPRFPDFAAGSVKKEIAIVLDELDAGIGYCSAACGADILFIEAMIERGAEVNVYLPFCAEDFLKTSVSYAGIEWEDRFFAILEKTSVKYITEEGYFGNDSLFSFLNCVIMGMSIIRARLLLTEPELLVVLGSAAKHPKQGSTSELLSRWPYKEKIRIIDPTGLNPPAAGSGKHKEKAKSAEPPVAGIPTGVIHSMQCILFAEIIGPGKAAEERTPYFMHDILKAVSERLKNLDGKPKIFSLWGDIIHAVFDGAKDALEFASMLMDVILGTKWGFDDTEQSINIRTALHAGPVFIGIDPITEKHNAYGTQVDRAACMRSIAVPGCIYASEEFTALLVVETGDMYRYEYVGGHDLSDDLQSCEMYHLSRREDFSFLISDYKRQRKLSGQKGETSQETRVIDSLQMDIFSYLKTDIQEKTEKEEKGDSFQWLTPYMTREKFRKGDILFNKGDIADKIYYLDKGTLRLKEINVTAGRGELIGETGIFSPFHTRTVSAICETDLYAFTMDQEKMISLLYKKPSFLFDLIKLSIKRFTTNLIKTVDEKQKIEHELKVAQAIQSSMLPKNFPKRDEFDIYATMEPAREVGGDFYDFFFVDKERLCFIIGDVSGKGVPAALFMVISKTLLKIEALHGMQPHEVLWRVNEMLIPDNEECMFVTVFCAVLNTKTGELQYSNAGHNPPLVTVKGRPFRFMSLEKSVVLGAFPGSQFTTEKITMEKDDTILLYTDGVNEAMNPESKQYSNRRFENTLNQLTGKSVNEILNGLREDVRKFVKKASQSDDITMLAVKYIG